MRIALTRDNVFGSKGEDNGWRFLHRSEDSGRFGASNAGSFWQGKDLVVKPGADIAERFNINRGDQLDLTKILTGAPLAADLTNIGDFVKVVGHGRNDPGFGKGTKTMLEIDGPNGSASISLQGSGKLTIDDLVKNNSLILPPHS